jgi:hypothetical protein
MEPIRCGLPAAASLHRQYIVNLRKKRKKSPSCEGDSLTHRSPYRLWSNRSLLAFRIISVDKAVAIIVNAIGTAPALLFACGHAHIVTAAGSVEITAVTGTCQFTTEKAKIGTSITIEVGAITDFVTFDNAVTANWLTAVECTAGTILRATADVITAAVAASINRNLCALEATRSTAQIAAGRSTTKSI